MKIISAQVKNGVQISLEASLNEDLGLSSLSMMIITYDIEEAFNITMNLTNLSMVKTVGDFIKIVYRYFDNKGG